MFCSIQYIPMPVLYGVFLYMGVASLSGIQVYYKKIHIYFFFLHNFLHGNYNLYANIYEKKMVHR